MIAARTKRGKPPENLYPVCFTSKRLKEQYEVLDGSIPSVGKVDIEEAAESHTDEERDDLKGLQLCVFASRPAGRPGDHERLDQPWLQDKPSRAQLRVTKKARDVAASDMDPSRHALFGLTRSKNSSKQKSTRALDASVHAPEGADRAGDVFFDNSDDSDDGGHQDADLDAPKGADRPGDASL